jgi:UDP-2,3-diacylglucosamine hydrolase
MHTLFASDLHLSSERPQILAQFLQFVNEIAARADALYILGDLFDCWIGDDAAAGELEDAVADALHRLAGRGIPVHLMHGNRDLLIGQAFAARCGCSIIADPTLLDLYGRPTLLLHGDALCTGDREYQQFRAYTRDPANQARFLAQPPEQRKQKMAGWLDASRRRKGAKTDDIMDVSPATVEQVLRAHRYPRMIHGHTHRPARHVHVVDGHACERWVLNDWYERGGYLACGRDGFISLRYAPWNGGEQRIDGQPATHG